MYLVLGEKPSVALAYAKVLGAKKRQEGYLEGNGWLVSWCLGHLAEYVRRRTMRKSIRSGNLLTFHPADDWRLAVAKIKRRSLQF